MLIRVIVAVFLFVPCQVYANKINCKPGKIKTYKLTKAVTKKDMICFLKSKGKSYLVSKSCKSKCLAIKKRLLDVKSLDLDPAKGNPSYQICKKINGYPELAFIKIKGKGKAVKKDRCIFKDGSFVENKYFYK